MPAPTIIAVTPAAEPADGSSYAQLIGTNFDSSLTVTVGGTPATGVKAMSQFLARFVCPAHAAGSVDVVATTSGGSATKTGAVTYLASTPSIASLAPNVGPADGGTVITIRGTGMASATGVTVGGIAATGVTVVDSGTITAITPAATVGTWLTPRSVMVLHPAGNCLAGTPFTFFQPGSGDGTGAGPCGHVRIIPAYANASDRDLAYP